jgi:hypothetical protein
MLTSNRGLALAFAGAAFASVVGCSLLLDTDKLQKGAGQAAAGASGSPADGAAPDVTADSEPSQDAAPDAEAEAEAEAATCNGDLDCWLASDRNLCFLHPCDKDASTCKPPEPWTGPVLVETSNTPIEITSNQDVIGVPALLADGEAVYVAAWYKNSGGTDALLHKYYPGQAVKKNTFLGYFKDYFLGPVATPGIMIETSPKKRLALLVPVPGLTSLSKSCVRRFWVGADLELPTEFPSACYDPVNALGDYTADPRRTAPRLLATSTSDIGAWIQDGELVAKPPLLAGEKVTSLGGTLKSFAPLQAVDPLRAALLEAGNSAAEEDTLLWYSGHSPSSLFGVAPGPRLGIATAWPEPSAGENVAVWSHPVAGGQTVEYFNVGCDNTKCDTLASQTPVEQGSMLHSPTVALRRNADPPYTDVSISAVYSFSTQQETESTMLTQVMRTKQPPEVSVINPGAVLMANTNVPGETAVSDLRYDLGRTSTVITAGGAMYVVWVQKVAGKEAMFMRTFQIKDTCGN